MKIVMALLSIFVSFLAVNSSHADLASGVGTMSGGASSVFSIEFYTDANVLHGAEGITFSNMDPRQSFVQADGRSPGDGKSDTGVVVRSNLNQTWYLKMDASTTTGFNLANFKYYMGRPWNRTLGIPADGAFATPDWYAVPTTSSTIYTAGANDLNNLLFGTLATFSFAIYPGGMTGGVVHSMIVTYTLTLTA